jgi:sugar lactone lactonase YvrE
MMRTILLVTFLLAGPVAQAAPSAALHFHGVLGNSGEQGTTLVRFATKTDLRRVVGIGVACDRFGTLWSRGGDGRLDRYAVDGRLLAQFAIPTSTHGGDRLVLLGNFLVMQLNERLWTLPVTAAAGQQPAPLKIKVTRLSFSAEGDSLLAADGDRVFWVDVRSGAQRPFRTMDHPVQWLEAGPAGVVCVVVGGQLHKFVRGSEATAGGGPRVWQGAQLQHLGDHWFTSMSHGTLRRFNEAMEADPGVVLGGGSGAFIGHLDENPEIDSPCGLAGVRDGLAAVCGSRGILHLLAWQPQKQQFDIVRRIGALPQCDGLALDRQGNIWSTGGVWHWDDRPDAPLTHGIPPLPGPVAAVMLDTDSMVASCRWAGKLAFLHGPLDREVTRQLVEKAKPLAADPCGAVVYRSHNRLTLLSVDAAGRARAFFIGSDGRYAADAGAVALRAAEPVAGWTALAMQDAETLVAAADGHVILFSRRGDDWAETGRWRSWGTAAADRFGDEIHLAIDADRLWVSDSHRHRVLVFDRASAASPPIAVFGVADRAGDDLRSLSQPTTIAARGGRAVVYDAGNQRLVKLAL